MSFSEFDFESSRQIFSVRTSVIIEEPSLFTTGPIRSRERKKDVKLIASVHTTKLVQGIQHWKYDDRLNYLGLMRLGVYDVNKKNCIYFGPWSLRTLVTGPLKKTEMTRDQNHQVP